MGRPKLLLGVVLVELIPKDGIEDAGDSVSANELLYVGVAKEDGDDTRRAFDPFSGVTGRSKLFPVVLGDRRTDFGDSNPVCNPPDIGAAFEAPLVTERRSLAGFSCMYHCLDNWAPCACLSYLCNLRASSWQGLIVALVQSCFPDPSIA